MKVLMIGGSGILSTDVCKTAIEKGFDVFLLNRGKRKYALQEKAKIIISDIVKESVDEVREKLDGLFFDIVIDFLAFKPEDVKKHFKIIKGNCNQYIFISSATAYEKSNENEIITENTSIGNQKWEYAYNKAISEKYIELNYYDYCKHWTVIRPYVTYNETRIPYAIIPGHANWTIVNRILHEKPIVLWDGGQAKCTITHSKDFAVGTVGLFGNPKAYEEAFHITSDYVMNWKEVLDDLVSVIGKKTTIVNLKTSYIIDILPEYAGVLLGDKGTNMLFDNSKIKYVVPEFTSSIPFKRGIEETILYYQKHSELQTVDYTWEGRLDYLLLRYYRQNKVTPPHTMNIKDYEGVSFKDRINYYMYRNVFTYTCIQAFYALRRNANRIVKQIFH